MKINFSAIFALEICYSNFVTIRKFPSLGVVNYNVDIWDKCKKLRKGIVKYLKSSGYSKDVLFDFTPFKNLNETLEGIWNRS